ncbi:MAG: DoxX family protein [Alphaproteobacteria bacterium]|jgi:putative oxidoreductase|nr:MAG: DoxX family protein [Alphaproteobacteria bacterium]
MSQASKVVDFIARLCLVLIFPFSALDKIINHQSAMAQAGHGLIALPPSLAALLLVLGGMLEVFGPVCILLDFYRRQAALLFVFYVIVTAVLFHNFWSFPFNSNEWSQNFWPFLKNFGLAGGFLYVAGCAGMTSLRDAFSLKPR